MIRSFCGFWVNAALHPSQVLLKLTFSESFVSNRTPTLTLHLMIHYEMSASCCFCSRPAKTPPLVLLKGSCLSSVSVLQIRGKVSELVLTVFLKPLCVSRRFEVFLHQFVPSRVGFVFAVSSSPHSAEGSADSQTGPHQWLWLPIFILADVVSWCVFVILNIRSVY